MQDGYKSWGIGGRDKDCMDVSRTDFQMPPKKSWTSTEKGRHKRRDILKRVETALSKGDGTSLCLKWE